MASISMPPLKKLKWQAENLRDKDLAQILQSLYQHPTLTDLSLELWGNNQNESYAKSLKILRNVLSSPNCRIRSWRPTGCFVLEEDASEENLFSSILFDNGIINSDDSKDSNETIYPSIETLDLNHSHFLQFEGSNVLGKVLQAALTRFPNLTNLKLAENYIQALPGSALTMFSSNNTNESVTTASVAPTNSVQLKAPSSCASSCTYTSLKEQLQGSKLERLELDGNPILLSELSDPVMKVSQRALLQIVQACPFLGYIASPYEMETSALFTPEIRHSLDMNRFGGARLQSCLKSPLSAGKDTESKCRKRIPRSLWPLVLARANIQLQQDRNQVHQDSRWSTTEFSSFSESSSSEISSYEMDTPKLIDRRPNVMYQLFQTFLAHNHGVC